MMKSLRSDNGKEIKEEQMHPLTEISARRMSCRPIAGKDSDVPKVEALRAEQEAEVMAFLGERPDHTFGMAGFIRTNGLVSPHNLGVFCSCRDQHGRLLGVALIGRYILFETRCDAAIEALARVAQECRTAHMLLGERCAVEAFWHYYAPKGQEPRVFCRELLLEQRWPMEAREAVPGLRLATLDDLELIVPAHAQSAFDECGIDPLKEDPDGFRNRCARRIERGQTWVWVDCGRLIFKAEVLTETPDVAYLEGVWVDPEQRGKGIGLRCMSQLGRKLLSRSHSICLLVNEKFQDALAFYQKAGYRFDSYYDTIFLKREVH